MFNTVLCTSNWCCNFSATGYRLPTEAEWDYASIEGVNCTNNYRYNGKTDYLEDYSWYSLNSGSLTHEFGTKFPNQHVIFYMSGNVWELSSYYGSGPTINPLEMIVVLTA